MADEQRPLGIYPPVASTADLSGEALRLEIERLNAIYADQQAREAEAANNYTAEQIVDRLFHVLSDYLGHPDRITSLLDKLKYARERAAAE